MLGQSVIHSSKDIGWRTPKPLYDRLCQAAGGFSWDLAASEDTALVRRGDGVGMYLGPGSRFGEDALTVDWHGMHGRRGFLNPPYSEELRREGASSVDISAWAEKAWFESMCGFETWGLFPYATQTSWWRTFVEGHGSERCEPMAPSPFHAAMEVWRLPHRVNFDPTFAMVERFKADFEAKIRKSPKASSAAHNVAVVIWRPNPGFVGAWQPALRYWTWREEA